MKDHFAIKAKDYDKEKRRVENVDNIANAIKNKIELKPNMNLLDLGSGTGLLLERIAPLVNSITAVDKSPSMNKELKAKTPNIGCKVEIAEIDLSKETLNKKFNGIISSMTLHHIKDIDALFKKFYNMLEIDGFLALADLDSEDGSFHTIDTGVEHFGFNREWIANKAKQAGFKNVTVDDASIVHKPYGKYSVFLLTATKTS